MTVSFALVTEQVRNELVVVVGSACDGRCCFGPLNAARGDECGVLLQCLNGGVDYVDAGVVVVGVDE